MIEKVGTVKNVLSIIAIFAAVTEVNGTIVLPLLTPENQGIFIWFLMIFPFVLLIFFFVTLWSKPAVLLSPSDFRSDEGFNAYQTNSVGDIIAPTQGNSTVFIKA